MAKTGLDNVCIHNFAEAADLPWDSLFEVKRWPWGIQSKSHTPKPSAHTKAVGKKPTDSGQLTKYN